MPRLHPVGPVRRRRALPPAITLGLCLILVAAFYGALYALTNPNPHRGHHVLVNVQLPTLDGDE